MGRAVTGDGGGTGNAAVLWKSAVWLFVILPFAFVVAPIEFSVLRVLVAMLSGNAATSYLLFATGFIAGSGVVVGILWNWSPCPMECSVATLAVVDKIFWVLCVMQFIFGCVVGLVTMPLGLFVVLYSVLVPLCMAHAKTHRMARNFSDEGDFATNK